MSEHAFIELSAALPLYAPESRQTRTRFGLCDHYRHEGTREEYMARQGGGLWTFRSVLVNLVQWKKIRELYGEGHTPFGVFAHVTSGPDAGSVTFFESVDFNDKLAWFLAEDAREHLKLMSNAPEGWVVGNVAYLDRWQFEATGTKVMLWKDMTGP